MEKVVPVSSKGQIVIPASLRKKLKIGRAVIVRDEGGRILVEPSRSMEESFGAGGDAMLDTAIEISKDRRREVESERA
jgi:AbrB family looped-hinge helix DNA binding protein